MDFRRRVLLEKSLLTSAKHLSEYSLKWVSTALESCNLPSLKIHAFSFISNEDDGETNEITTVSLIIIKKQYHP